MFPLTIRKYLYFAFAGFILIPFFVSVVVSIAAVKRIMIERTHFQMEARLDLKSNQIINWVKQGRKAAKLVSKLGVDEIADLKIKNHSRLQQLIKSGYKLYINQIADAFPSVRSISILNPDSGRVIFSTDSLFIDRLRVNEEYFSRGKTGPFVSSIVYSLGREQPVLNISRPMKSDQGELLAVVTAEMELSNLEINLNSRAFLNETEKIYTIDTFGFYVTMPDERKKHPLQMVQQNETTRQLLNKNSGNARYVNESGIEVLSAYRWLPENNLGLYIEKNYEEVIEPINQLQSIFLITSAIIFISILFVVYFVSTMIIKPINQVATIADFLQRGDFSQRANLKGPREARILAKSFNEMASTIQASQNESERLIKNLQHEIAERKQIEYKLKIAKKDADFANSAKSEFLANISHELRNPMHHILSYSKYGVEKSSRITDDKKFHYFKQIRKSAERLTFLLNDLLDLSKMEAGKMDYCLEKSDLFKVIFEAVEELNGKAKSRDIFLKIDRPNISTESVFDKFKIGQVVRNLISNAIQYSGTGQTISILVEQQNKLDQTINKSFLCVSVKDEGVGIPFEELNIIFDKFIQSSITKTGAGGTGLGLAISYEIIKAHKGNIWAENNPGRGSIFKFTLPVL